MEPDEAPDLKSLRYVLYARKSTEDDNRQVRSIPDQIRECKKLAEQLGLRIVEIIKETKSAKKPQQRPHFTTMLENLASGKKYDAILCWHPDRLARNMKEAGEIADPQQIKLTKAQFLNVVKTASDKMKAGTAAEKDTLCRILFLNLRVDNEKAASYLWREPFASMVKATELSLGARERT